MIELSPTIVTVIMMGAFIGGVLSGYPLAIVTGGAGVIIGFLLFGQPVFNIIYMQMFGILANYVLLALPLFVFMGIMLGHSGIADRMYGALYQWFGGFRGGLAITTVLLGTILAATVGVVAAAVTMLTLVALPPMVRRGYSKAMATGACCAGGSLGILIPPSTLLIVYGPMARISVGKLFFGAFGPGLLLSILYCTYIAIISFIRPKMAPAVPVEERNVPFIKKTTMLLTSMAPTALLIMGVLGTIFLGIAAPTEAAAVGAFVATLLALAYRKLNWAVLKEAGTQTVKNSGMIFLIAASSVAFTAVFLRAGGGEVVQNFILSFPFGRWGAFALIMLICFLLGYIIIDLGIIFIMVPIITPIFKTLGFDPVWAAIMVNINLQMSYMTPPMAIAIFFVRGTAPPELGINIGDIIRGVIPFVFLIMIGLALCTVLPQIITWLPGMMIE
jgi:tripartite ATP-independent transporter DctM subunit